MITELHVSDVQPTHGSGECKQPWKCIAYRVDIGKFFKSAIRRRSDKSKGKRETWYRAYKDPHHKCNGSRSFPQLLLWGHRKDHYPGESAKHLAMSWFRQDMGRPAVLLEENFIDGVLVSARAIDVRPDLLDKVTA